MPGDSAPAIVKGSIHQVMRYTPACHPKAGMVPTVVPALHLMILRCAECSAEQMRVKLDKEGFSEGDALAKSDGQIKLS